jgi:hypothetical protein
MWERAKVGRMEHVPEFSRAGGRTKSAMLSLLFIF